jgi:hypothetical protein
MLITGITLAVALLGVLSGMLLQRRLPEDHRNQESKAFVQTAATSSRPWRHCS